jgi:hypothetical protein
MPLPDFTSAELTALSDDAYFDLRIRTDNKIKEVFSQLKQKLEVVNLETPFPLPEVWQSGPSKLHRGENYNGRPWRALDYPATFSPTDIFAFRTVLIWGRHISFNLILQGKYFQPAMAEALLEACRRQPQIKLWQYPELWKWEIDQPYCSFLDEGTDIPNLPFFRILLPLPIHQVAEMPEKGAQFWQLILKTYYEHLPNQPK